MSLDARVRLVEYFEPETNRLEALLRREIEAWKHG